MNNTNEQRTEEKSFVVFQILIIGTITEFIIIFLKAINAIPVTWTMAIAMPILITYGLMLIPILYVAILIKLKNF